MLLIFELETHEETPFNPLFRKSEERFAKDNIQQIDDTVNSLCRKRKHASVESDDLNCLNLDTQMQQDPISSMEVSNLHFPSLNSLLTSFEDDHQISRNRRHLVTLARKAIDRYQGSDQSFVQLAQITAEQLTVLSEFQGSLLNGATEDLIRSSRLQIGCLEDRLRHILPRIFPRSEQCNLEAYLSVDEYPPGLAQVSKSVSKHIPRKHETVRGGQDADKGAKDVFLIPAPNILVQRGNTLMEVSPTVLPFWDQLGLEPSAGPKDVRALCIYPQSQMMRRSAEAFLETIGGTYQSMRLGNHNRRSVVEFEDGLVPVHLDGSAIEETTRALEEICKRLGRFITMSWAGR